MAVQTRDAFPRSTVIQKFEYYCPKCRKRRVLHVEDGYVGDKSLDFINCVCGHSISVDILVYMSLDKDFIEEKKKYFVC